MCFTVTTRKEIAKKDIRCYKIVTFKGIGNYISRLQDFPYEDGYHYYDDCFPENCWRGQQLGGGGMHSYRNVRTIATCCGFVFYDQSVSIECIIPKGSKYYKNRSEYFSSDLIVVGKIDASRYKQLAAIEKRQKERLKKQLV